MKPEYAKVMKNIQRGKPHRFLLQDGSSFDFKKKGKDYRMVLRDTHGTVKDKRFLNEDGLEYMFESFSAKAKYLNVREN